MPSVLSQFSKELLMKLIGETINGARVVDSQLIVTRIDGNDIDAGNNRGVEATNPTATNISVTPASTISSTNAQAALQELASDFTALSTSKADKTSLPVITSGVVTHLCTVDGDGASERTVVDYVNIFPSGLFAVTPYVFVTPNTSQPGMLAKGFSTLNINRRSFSINAWSGASPPRTTFHYVAVEP